MLRHSILLIVASSLGAEAQSLLDALSQIPSLSNFTAFYRGNAVFANALLGNTSNYPITFLAPNDQAFAAYQARYGASITTLPPATLLALLQYHTLVANVSKDDLSNDGGRGGTTIPTMLTTQSNNRSVGVAMAARYGGPERANGQVVFIKNAGTSPNKFLLTRQDNRPSNSIIRSGLSSDLNIVALEGNQGKWDGGRFHIIDGLLTPPQLCTATIRNANLTSLDRALNKTGLWPALDGSKNVTCLGPNDQAFKNAGSPDSVLNGTTLSDAILFHTLPEVAYSDYLYDGQMFKTLQNGTVKVRIQGSGNSRNVWFNNAKLVEPNVLTHNGLMHVLDAVMVPLEQMNTTSSPSASTPASATRTGGNPASTGAASMLKQNGQVWAMWAMLIIMLLMI